MKDLLKTRHFQSIDEILACEPQLNDLWVRSDLTNPTYRPKFLHQWQENFSGKSGVRGIAVVDSTDQFIAAMFFADGRKRFGIQFGKLAANDWADCGELLIDRQQMDRRVFDALVKGMTELPWPIVEIQEFTPERKRWTQFSEAIKRAKRPERFTVTHSNGVIEPGNDFESFLKGLSKSHRKNLGRRERRLAETGGLSFKALSPTSRNETIDLLERGFQLEDRGWKGSLGTSLVKSEQIKNFVFDQACELASQGFLRVFMLELDDQLIAFEYGWYSAGVYYSFKTAYCESHSEASPGQLLLGKVLEHFANHREPVKVDVMGPPNEAVRAWRPSETHIGTLSVANSSVASFWLKTTGLFKAARH